MQWHTLYQSIRNRKKSGESYAKIGRELGISAPSIERIYQGIKPGKKLAKKLGLDPYPELEYTRKRNARLNAIAKLWGHSSWSAYETAVLADYYKET